MPLTFTPAQKDIIMKNFFVKMFDKKRIFGEYHIKFGNMKIDDDDACTLSVWDKKSRFSLLIFDKGCGMCNVSLLYYPDCEKKTDATYLTKEIQNIKFSELEKLFTFDSPLKADEMV
jgi:hypothetical protein